MSDLGAAQAIVEAMRAHEGCAGVQAKGCWALCSLAYDHGPDGGAARKQRAFEAGALDAIFIAFERHTDDAAVRNLGMRAVLTICGGDDAAAMLRRHRLAKLEQRSASQLGRAQFFLHGLGVTVDRAAGLQRLDAPPGKPQLRNVGIL